MLANPPRGVKALRLQRVVEMLDGPQRRRDVAVHLVAVVLVRAIREPLRDLAREIVHVLEAPANVVQSQVYNVGDRRLNATIGQLGELVADVAREFRGPVTITVHEQAAEDRRNYLVAFEKIRRHLGFEVETELRDGIREMAQRFADGSYQHYRDEVYSNVATTVRAVEHFHDPLESQRLYAPRRVG